MKDISIDDGVPSQEKILFESGTDEKTFCIFLPAEKDQNKEPVKEKEDIDMSIPDASQGFDDDKGRLLWYYSEWCLQRDFLPGEKLPVVDMGTYTFHYKSSNNDEVEQQPFQVFIP